APAGAHASDALLVSSNEPTGAVAITRARHRRSNSAATAQALRKPVEQQQQLTVQAQLRLDRARRGWQGARTIAVATAYHVRPWLIPGSDAQRGDAQRADEENSSCKFKLHRASP